MFTLLFFLFIWALAQERWTTVDPEENYHVLSLALMVVIHCSPLCLTQHLRDCQVNPSVMSKLNGPSS